MRQYSVHSLKTSFGPPVCWCWRRGILMGSLRRSRMRTFPVYLASLALVVIGILAGCSQTPTKSPDVSDAIRKSLDQAGLKDVSVTQDREKGVVTLAGHVAAEGDKSQAESIAKSIAGGQVVANQVA